MHYGSRDGLGCLLSLRPCPYRTKPRRLSSSILARDIEILDISGSLCPVLVSEIPQMVVSARDLSKTVSFPAVGFDCHVTARRSITNRHRR